MYHKIMVPLDGSELAECVLPHVESIAKGCGVAEVLLVRAVEPFRMPPNGVGFFFTDEDIEKIDNKNEADAKEYLDQVANRSQLSGALVRKQVIMGKTAESLANFANQNEVDLIVIATHGYSGVSRWVWGSVADRLLHAVRMPVLMVRAPGCIPNVQG